MLKSILAEMHTDTERLTALLMCANVLDLNASDERIAAVVDEARKELIELGVMPPAAA